MWCGDRAENSGDSACEPIHPPRGHFGQSLSRAFNNMRMFCSSDFVFIRWMNGPNASVLFMGAQQLKKGGGGGGGFETPSPGTLQL